MAEATAGRTTVGVERTVARTHGMVGVDPEGRPLVNVLVDHAPLKGLATQSRRIIGGAIVQTARSVPEVAGPSVGGRCRSASSR